MDKYSGKSVLITTVLLTLLISGTFFVLSSQQKRKAAVAPTNAPIRSSSNPNTTANWKTYANTTYKYSIQYPTDWYIVEANSKPDMITFSSPRAIDGSPALISIYVRKTKKLDSQWQQQYKPFYAIDSKQKGEETYIMRVGSYEEGVGISSEREKLAIEIFDLMFSTLRFAD